MAEKYLRNPNTVCQTCVVRIYRRPSEIKKGRVFCSKTCNGVSDRKEHPCEVCGLPILAGLNKRTCSRSCSNIHRTGIKYKIGRPRDKVVTLRAIKLRLIKERGSTCERCPYSKTPVLQVHHRDRNHSNNVVENLELICPNCHYEEHYLEKRQDDGTLGD